MCSFLVLLILRNGKKNVARITLAPISQICRSALLLLSCFVLGGVIADAQPVPAKPKTKPHLEGLHAYATFLGDCPDCSAEQISLHDETVNRLQGVKSVNPSAPSSYKLIGNHKFSGSGWGFTNSFWGENWYAIRTEKQNLTGTFYHFGVANYGDESDWNIDILPDEGFEDFVSDAIPYRRDNWYADADWSLTSDGKVLIEAEITPDERQYGNPWFTNNTSNSPLLGKKLTVYGPFIREECHGNHPEIHPAEQICWKEGDNVTMAMLLIDDSNRFKRRADTVVFSGGTAQVVGGDYSSRTVTTLAYHPWAIEDGQEEEVDVAFDVDPSKATLKYEVQSVDAMDFHKGASYPDATPSDLQTVSYQGSVVLSVQKAAAIAPFVGVTFRDVCFNRAKGTVQGYIVLKTALGNGDGHEGFVVLRIEKKEIPPHAKPAILVGDIANTWKTFSEYDEQILISDIITSDRQGKGIVNGYIDFNGNGKTDLFAKKGDSWMVLFDGKGKWTQIGTSSIPVEELRFGDVDGDGKTDILRVGPGKKVLVSYGGTQQWTQLTDGGEQNNYIQVGDFNGDGKVDIVYLKFEGGPPAIPEARLYVKYGCKGSWTLLNKSLHILATNAKDYYDNVRFGNFNGDKVTDIFRYTGGKFCVYYNGTGDLKELCKPGISLRMDDLLFVDRLMMPNSTDVIYVNPNTKQWTVFSGGKESSLPLTLKYGDPSTVRFADLDADPAAEPFTIDYAQFPPSALEVPLTPVVMARIEPSIMPRYLPGSLKRSGSGDGASFTMSMNLNYFPGSETARRKRSDFEAVSTIKERLGSKTLRFRKATAAVSPSGGVETMGIIDDVPLSRKAENEIHVAFAAESTAKTFRLSAFAITGVINDTNQSAGGSGNWQDWKPLLSQTAGTANSSLLAAPPAPPSHVGSVKFELLPFYASIEEGNARMSEMDDAVKEMNDVAYGSDANKKKELLSDTKVFSIEWKFELKDVTSGTNLQAPSLNSIASNGKWEKSKIAFTFPSSTGLIQFKATATIKDRLGNSTVKPIEMVFWNQRIPIENSDQEISAWLAPLKDSNPSDYKYRLAKGNYLAEDKFLTPSEMSSLVK